MTVKHKIVIEVDQLQAASFERMLYHPFGVALHITGYDGQTVRLPIPVKSISFTAREIA